MSTQGPISVDTLTDAGGGDFSWDTSTPGTATMVAVGAGTTNLLSGGQFNADDFSVPGGNVVTDVSISFDVNGNTDMGSTRPTANSIKINIGLSDASDGAEAPITTATWTYGGDLWGTSSITLAAINGAWQIELIFSVNGSGPEQSSLTISNVSATVDYVPSDDDLDGNAHDIAMRSCVTNGVLQT